MNAHATIPHVEVEFTIGEVPARLEGYDALPLAMEEGGHIVLYGYHVTKVKAGSIIALDCGGNPGA